MKEIKKTIIMGTIKIKDLNLDELVVQGIANKLGWSVEDVLKCDDFYITELATDMMAWIFEDSRVESIMDYLDDSYVTDPKLSLLENLLLSKHNVFEIDGGYLFFYV